MIEKPECTFTACATIEKGLNGTEVVLTMADQRPFVSAQVPSSPLSPPVFEHNAEINVSGRLFATLLLFFFFQ